MRYFGKEMCGRPDRQHTPFRIMHSVDGLMGPTDGHRYKLLFRYIFS
jgi:hypothetical protein